MRAFVALVAIVLACAGCGPERHEVRVRHEPKRALRYELVQHEEAPNPDVGYGGTLDVACVVKLACLEVESGGRAHVEATVEHARLAGPPEMGIAVDTQVPRPMPGDKIGAGSVVRALLPRTALLRIGPRGDVFDARPDPEVGRHVSEWIRGKPLATRRGILRLAESLDAGTCVATWWSLLPDLFPDGAVAHGARWTCVAKFPTPGGDVTAELPLIHRREGDVSVVEGSGTLTLAGAAPGDRTAEFEKGTLARTLRVDTARGVLVGYTEVRDMVFRVGGPDGARAAWLHRLELRLVE